MGVVAALTLVGLVGWGGSATAKSSARPGAEIVLRSVFPSGMRTSDSELDRSVEIMRNRLVRLGAQGSVSHQAGSQLVVIRLDDVSLAAAQKEAEIIGKRWLLEFYDLTPSLLSPSINASQNPVATTRLFDLLTRVQTGQQGTPTGYYLFNTKTKRVVAGPADTRAHFLKSRGGKLPMGMQVLSVPPKAIVITCDSTIAVVCPGIGRPAAGVTYYYLFKHGTYAHDTSSPYPQITGKDLKLSGTAADFDPTTSQPIVTMKFTGQGNKVFHEITRAEAVRGQALGQLQSFAIVLDSQIYSFPTIDYRSYPDGIDPTANGAEVAGIASPSEAKHLAVVLQTGTLPVAFVAISERAAR
jgi:preprotein translocase subunit SecD